MGGFKFLGNNGFQSTLPRVERPDALMFAAGLVSISIHAPASGATPATPPSWKIQRDFNPRSREWSDKEDRTCK